MISRSRIPFAIAASLVSMCAGTLLPGRVVAQGAKADVAAFVDARAAHFADVAQRIWDLAEVGYQETASAQLLQDELAGAGFRVESGVAAIPTAFVATWGEGEPVIAILAEYDALPGITQDRVPQRHPLDEKRAGHACGHHLFGTGSVAAALAVRDWMERTGTTGTLRLVGTPAEEGGSGKVYLTRAGIFDDVDAVLHWHAADSNDASPGTTLANISAKFRFTGISAHAAAAPDRGRSALDGVEAMNYMVNLMREHVPQETRIHYVITRGGEAPNVVPDFAEVYVYVRHPDGGTVRGIFDRVIAASEGAAQGTGTTVEHEIIGGVYSTLPNETLARVMDANLRTIGGVAYDATDREFADILRTSLPDAPPIETAAEIQPFVMQATSASTDVGDVSWRAPTTGLNTATWVPGTAAHSWQAVAAGGTDIGAKGMIVAAKTIALTALDLFGDPATLKAARAEFAGRLGADFVYRPLVGDRKPPLDYRR